MRPFRIEVPQADLDDLTDRLTNTRWPDQIPGTGWERGVPLAYLRELAEYWRTGYQWRTHEERLNQYPHYTTTIDGINIHFMHIRSPEPRATPLLITHGWPSSVTEYLNIIDPLTNPRAHGGHPDEAFHLVIPTLPGFTLSGPTHQPGWDFNRTAGAWAQLMNQLGYQRYLAQGGDFGTWITFALAATDPEHLRAAHVNFLVTPPTGDPGETVGLSESDRERLGLVPRFNAELSGYMKLHSTRPQTVSYALTDSPVGQLAWIIEKFYDWTDAEKSPEDAVDRDLLLTNASLYWFTATASSSAQIYYEVADLLSTAPTPPPAPPPLPTPLGVAVYAGDVVRPVRRLADRGFPNIIHWREYDRGGHFPALEEPDLFVADLRAFGRTLP